MNNIVHVFAAFALAVLAGFVGYTISHEPLFPLACIGGITFIAMMAVLYQSQKTSGEEAKKVLPRELIAYSIVELLVVAGWFLGVFAGLIKPPHKPPGLETPLTFLVLFFCFGLALGITFFVSRSWKSKNGRACPSGS